MEHPGHGDAERGNSPLRQYLSEHDVLRECELEAFTYRSLPLMLASLATVTWALRTKRILIVEGGSKVPLYVATTVISLLAGKFSYRMVCAQKLLKITSELEARRNLEAQNQPSEQQLQWEMTTDSNGQGPAMGSQSSAQTSKPSTGSDSLVQRGGTTTNRYGDSWSQ